MACLDGLPVENKEMIWEHVDAEHDTIVIVSKKFPHSSNNIPSLCSPTSAQAYSRESANIIHDVVLKGSIAGSNRLCAHIQNFDFTNLIRFIKYFMATPPNGNEPRGDPARLAHDDDYNAINVNHFVTANLERQPAKLATWIKFADNLHKKEGLVLGAFHELQYPEFVEESPTLWDLVESQDTPLEYDGSQAGLIRTSLHHWSVKTQFVMMYGSVAEGKRQHGFL